MRKLMVMAAMLAMMLVAASPAFAQVVSDDDLTITAVDASQSVDVSATQSQLGDASDEASISASLSVSATQINGGFGFPVVVFWW